MQSLQFAIYKCLYSEIHVIIIRWILSVVGKMQWMVVLYTALMISSSLFSVCGNIVLLFVLLLNRSLQTETWTLTLSCCVCDLALGLSIIPFGAHNSLFRQQGYSSSSMLCKGSAFFFLLLQLASVHSVTWTAIDKFTEICFALNYASIFTAYRTRVILVIIWMYSLLNAALPLLGFGSYGYSSSRFLCAPSFKPANTAFNMLFIVVGIIVPILAMCSMYGYIVYVARNQVRRGTFVCNEQHCFYVPAKNYFKSSIVMVATIVCLLICWLPYITICFYETLTGGECPQSISAVATWLVLFTSALNPWINSMTQTRYRAALRRSVKKIRQTLQHAPLTPPPECTTTQRTSKNHSFPSTAPAVAPAPQTHIEPLHEQTGS